MLALLLVGAGTTRLPMMAVLARSAMVMPFSATFAASWISGWISGDSARAVGQSLNAKWEVPIPSKVGSSGLPWPVPGTMPS
jgi:hypothetical protein